MTATDLLDTMKDKPLSLQTLSNRDLVNRLYFERYEDCVQSLNNSIKGHDDNFEDKLRRLYWSFIVPRHHYLTSKYKGYEEKLNEEKITKKEAEDMLKAIAELMWKLGVNKPERETTDPEHGFQKEKESIP